MQIALKNGLLTQYALDYDFYIRTHNLAKREALEQFLAQKMSTIWCDVYRRMTNHVSTLLEISDCGYQYIFDHASVSNMPRARIDDRVVACWGKSQSPHSKRDSSRMSSFIGSSAELDANNIRDKGHIMSHGSGGGLDINLYPQRRDLNQRRRSNPASYVYAEMEKYTRENSNVFFFNRLLYSDNTWIPSWIEFGVVKLDGNLWVEVFDN